MKQLFTILIIGLILSACDNPKPAERKIADSSGRPTLKFQVDKRVETVYFVFMLTGEYDVLISQHPTDYRFAAKKYFSKFKYHNAVQLAKKLMDKGFGADYAANWIFQFSDFPVFQKNNEVNYPFGELSLNSDTIELFRKELINFYNESKCNSFFSSQKEFLDTMISKTANSFSKKDLPQTIEDYYGVTKNVDFFVTISPLLHSGGYGIDCDNKTKNKSELFALIGPNGETEFTPTFDNEFIEQDLIIHEFGHSYANPIVDKFAADTKPFENTLFLLIKDKLANEGIVQKSFIYELIVRAVTIRIVANNYGQEQADKLLDYEKLIGFNYVEEIADELKNYERQRNKYPALTDFYPKIIKRLKQIKI